MHLISFTFVLLPHPTSRSAFSRLYGVEVPAALTYTFIPYTARLGALTRATVVSHSMVREYKGEGEAMMTWCGQAMLWGQRPGREWSCYSVLVLAERGNGCKDKRKVVLDPCPRDAHGCECVFVGRVAVVDTSQRTKST